MTVVELIERVSARLDQAGVSFGHGTTQAFDEAAWLVLWALEHPLDALDDVASHEVAAAQAQRVWRLVEQRVQTRLPTAYLTGEAWLQGLAFDVDPRVIIPRSLIAEVIADGTVDPWLSGQTQRVLDLCTGNGSLAVLAALAWPQVQVWASDLSADALAVAARNVQRHELTARIELLQGEPPWPHCPPNTAPSRPWPWTAETTAWTSSGSCCLRCATLSLLRACWCLRLGTNENILKRPSLTWSRCGCPPARATIRSCC